jgi:hypothetical protein
MSAARASPFNLVFRESADTVFPAIREALTRGGRNPRSRDDFLMVPESVSLVRELRPDEGLGEGIDRLAALVHHAYLYWDEGERTVALSPAELEAMLSTDFLTMSRSARPGPAFYAELPLRRVWAEVVEGQPPEPLDGCFVHHSERTGNLRVLGVFGMHPERSGFSVAEVEGPRVTTLQRADGTALFSPILPGGSLARLFSVAGGEELLELGWRIELGAEAAELGAHSSLSGRVAPGQEG